MECTHLHKNEWTCDASPEEIQSHIGLSDTRLRNIVGKSKFAESVLTVWYHHAITTEE